MQILEINRLETELFSAQQIDLAYNQQRFIPFINHVFSLDAFEKVMDDKAAYFTLEKRIVLKDALMKQYENCTLYPQVKNNIDSLQRETTYTITTGHQLSNLTGPLYFIYKILHVIKQTEELNAQHLTKHFVPVYWMATEDHDFEEIKSCFLFNKPMTWASNESGPVGRFSMDQYDVFIEEIKQLFSNHPDSELIRLLDRLEADNYAAYFRKLINELFGKYGLVIVDGDDAALKQEFLPIMQKELEEQFSIKAVDKTNAELEKEGLKIQVTARPINLFYIEKGLRERIEVEGNGFKINGKGSFSKEEMMALLVAAPQSFSPNVVLRPVYQECILPNLNYVGGTGEISYWLQLKRVFDACGIVYPLIQVRNSVLWIDEVTHEKMQKIDMTIDQVFHDAGRLKKKYVEENSSDELNFHAIDTLFSELKMEILTTVNEVDSQLESFGIAETTRMEKQMTGIKDKLYRMSKGKHEKALKSIDQIKDRLFPEGSMQERKVNFFQLTPDGHYSDLIDVLKDNMKPFSPDFLVVLN